MATDFRELEAFRDKIAELAEGKCSEFCDDCTKELAARLLAKTVRRTPVGKKPEIGEEDYIDDKGKAHYVWNKQKMTTAVEGVSGKKKKMLSAKGAQYQQNWNGYQGGTLRRGWTTEPLTRSGAQHNINVINPVPYASYVEFGHSQEPGRYVPAIDRKLKKSWVRGQFMLTDSVKEINRKAPQIVQAKLNEFLDKELK